jgi:hypothetical protein
MVLLLSLLLSGCGLRPYTYYGGTSVVTTNKEIFAIDYGYKGGYSDALAFVVFQHGTGQLVPKTKLQIRKIPSGKAVCEGTILTPSGQTVDLTTAWKGFQYDGDKDQEFALTFSRTDLERFLQSKPTRYDINTLTAFLRAANR